MVESSVNIVHRGLTVGWAFPGLHTPSHINTLVGVIGGVEYQILYLEVLSCQWLYEGYSKFTGGHRHSIKSALSAHDGYYGNSYCVYIDPEHYWPKMTQQEFDEMFDDVYDITELCDYKQETFPLILGNHICYGSKYIIDGETFTDDVNLNVADINNLGPVRPATVAIEHFVPRDEEMYMYWPCVYRLRLYRLTYNTNMPKNIKYIEVCSNSYDQFLSRFTGIEYINYEPAIIGTYREAPDSMSLGMGTFLYVIAMLVITIFEQRWLGWIGLTIFFMCWALKKGQFWALRDWFKAKPATVEHYKHEKHETKWEEITWQTEDLKKN